MGLCCDVIDGMGEWVPNDISESLSESVSGESVGCKCRPPRLFELFPESGGWFNL